MSIDDILADIKEEFNRAVRKHGLPEKFSPHECYGVLLEEVDELWDSIKANNSEHARKEAVQVGAMALRYLFMSAT